MKTLGYYNGHIDELDRMQVPMLDRACYFGDGVYDVTFSRNHNIFELDEHIERLMQSATLVRIAPPMGHAELAALVRSLVAQVEDGEQWIYLQFSRGTGLRAHAFPQSGAQTNLWIMLRPMQIRDLQIPMRCITYPDTRFSHCNAKSLNLLPNVLASQAAAEAQVDECILVRDGIVTECAHSNLSILKNGVLITHPADCHIYAGTARAHLLRECGTHGIPVEERTYTVEELWQADEVLLCSASALCIRVTELDGRPIGGNAPDTVRILQDALLADFLSKTAAPNA